jgi:RNA polymerase sigma-70 factor (ECF subfamily)
VFAFVCRNAADPEAARDLTQEFFARLLARQGIRGVDRQRGRFRSFLLGAVKNFLGDARDREHRLKRGGGQPIATLSQDGETSAGLQVPDRSALSPDREFDRKWGLAVLDLALGKLAQEHEAAGKATQFAVLKLWLTGDNENISQAEAANQLGMNEGAVKVAVHRLRRRFRELVKAEVAQTTNDPSEVEDELACLLAALTGT